MKELNFKQMSDMKKKKALIYRLFCKTGLHAKPVEVSLKSVEENEIVAAINGIYYHYNKVTQKINVGRKDFTTGKVNYFYEIY